MKKNSFVEKVFIANSSKETQKVGNEFAKFLEKGDVICLYGDLGSGKTTFVQGLAQGLEIKHRIISPTFIIVRSYELDSVNFYHIDLYRIGSNTDIRSLGIEEIIGDQNNIVVVEWAEKLKNYLPKNRIDIKFNYGKDNVRKILFRPLNQ
jgi:tRNA threonylcarbamoyladenosine biosynthesis protein TsaE